MRIAEGDFVRAHPNVQAVVPVGIVLATQRAETWPHQPRCLVGSLRSPDSMGVVGIDRQWIDAASLEPVPTLDEITPRRRAWLNWFVPHLVRVCGLDVVVVAERVGLLPDAVRAIEAAAPAKAGVP